MKIKLLALLTSVLLLFGAMHCDDYSDDYPYSIKILSLEAVNVNNEGQEPLISDKPVKKEAYMISLRALCDVVEFKMSEEVRKYYSNYDYRSSERVICTSGLNEEYPAGSDITELLQITNYSPSGYTRSYFFKEVPKAGTYSFRIEVTDLEDNVFSADCPPITLY